LEFTIIRDFWIDPAIFIVEDTTMVDIIVMDIMSIEGTACIAVSIIVVDTDTIILDTEKDTGVVPMTKISIQDDIDTSEKEDISICEDISIIHGNVQDVNMKDRVAIYWGRSNN